MEKLENYYDEFIDLIPSLALGFAVLIITIFIAIIIRRFLVKRLKSKTKNPLLVSFIGKIAALTINILGIIVFLGIVGLGSVSSKLLAGAGIATFVIGFAFKDIGENFLSGVLLAFKSPFGVNDLIESGDTVGYVTEVNLRETIIKTLDGKDVFIPNSQILNSPLVNYTIDGFLRYEFAVGIDYDCDADKAIRIIERVISQTDEVLRDKKPLVFIDELMASTVNIKVLYWIDTFNAKSKSNHNQIRSKLIKNVYKALIAENIYMPADIIELKNHNTNTLKLNNPAI